jgi:predicted HAD superfamily Cof-like phosphohydrolase
VSNTNVLRRIFNWFCVARGTETTRKDFNTQLGVHFEEVGEMLEELSAQTVRGTTLIEEAHEAVTELANFLKTNPNAVVVKEENRIGFLDALCDQIVTAVGTAHTQKMIIDEATEEVDRSNWSKFVNDKAIFDQNGKITKGPDYFKPDLSKFV